MCLYKLKKIELKTDVGYKLFIKEPQGLCGISSIRTPKKLYSLLYSNNKALETNTWLNEKDYRINFRKKDKIITNNQEAYPVGWHIFLNRKDAEYDIREHEWNVIIRKVRFKNVVATGIEKAYNKEDSEEYKKENTREYEIVVAKDMFIL